MARILLISLFIGFTFLCLQANGYTYTESLNTESGFCEGHYGKIAVGESGYDDENCEEILCHHGGREVLGCGKVILPEGLPNCELVSGEGNYPDCCPTVRCSQAEQNLKK